MLLLKKDFEEGHMWTTWCKKFTRQNKTISKADGASKAEFTDVFIDLIESYVKDGR